MNIFKKFSCIMISLICILNVSFYPNYIFAQNTDDFKVVAYCSDLFKDPVETNIQYDKVTHIIYAFLIPKEDGSFVPVKKPDELKKLVKKGHENNVKVLIAVGGWFDESYAPLDNRFEKIAASDKLRSNFVDNLNKFVEEYNLDGVEIDWEYPDLGQSSLNYEKLILELNSKLKENNKYLTAALNGAWSKEEGPEVSKSVTPKCLESFDWISIMAYDMNNEQHSPFWFADTSIEYWLNRGVPNEKIVIGIPFYAHPTNPTWKVYRDFVKEDRENAYKDTATIDGINYYYNGINTVKEKTRLALNKASGVMLFDVNEDTLDDLSLVKSIDDVITEASSITFEQRQNKLNFVVANHELIFNQNDNLGVPFIDDNNRTLVPVRKALQSINVTVSYNDLDRVVHATKGNNDLRIPINKDYIYLNGQKIQMDTNATIINGRTYIPLRYVFESFNYKITWHESSKTIISTPQS